MYLDNRINPIDHWSKVKVISFVLWTKVYQIVFINVGKIVVPNAVFRFSIA